MFTDDKAHLITRLFIESAVNCLDNRKYMYLAGSLQWIAHVHHVSELYGLSGASLSQIR